jgi:hypothetical protein
MCAEDIRPAKDDCEGESMQNKRASKVAAEVIAGELDFSTEFDVSGYGTLLTSESAG